MTDGEEVEDEDLFFLLLAEDDFALPDLIFFFSTDGDDFDGLLVFKVKPSGESD